MAIEGPIRELAIPDLLQLIHLSRKTGTLTVASDAFARPGVVYFDRGIIVGATSPGESSDLGQLLLMAGKVTERQIREAVEVQRATPGKRLGEVLVERAGVPRAEVERQLRFQVEETVYELVRWTEGYFRFEENPPPPMGAITLRISTESLLMEALRRVDEWSMLASGAPDTALVPRLVEVGTAAGVLNLQPGEWEVLAAIDGDRTLRAIARSLGRAEFEVAKSVFSLVSVGIVELRKRVIPSASESQPGSAPRAAAPELARLEADLQAGRLEKVEQRLDELAEGYPAPRRAAPRARPGGGAAPRTGPSRASAWRRPCASTRCWAPPTSTSASPSRASATSPRPRRRCAPTCASPTARSPSSAMPPCASPASSPSCRAFSPGETHERESGSTADSPLAGRGGARPRRPGVPAAGGDLPARGSPGRRAAPVRARARAAARRSSTPTTSWAASTATCRTARSPSTSSTSPCAWIPSTAPPAAPSATSAWSCATGRRPCATWRSPSPPSPSDDRLVQRPRAWPSATSSPARPTPPTDPLAALAPLIERFVARGARAPRSPAGGQRPRPGAARLHPRGGPRRSGQPRRGRPLRLRRPRPHAGPAPLRAALPGRGYATALPGRRRYSPWESSCSSPSSAARPRWVWCGCASRSSPPASPSWAPSAAPRRPAPAFEARLASGLGARPRRLPSSR